jgi:putative ABC transport system permease protein
MRGLIKDFKNTPMVWGGVFLLLIVVQTLIPAMRIMMSNAAASRGDVVWGEKAGWFVGSMSGLTYPVTLFAGVLVIMMVVSASIQQRRSDLALFSLQGATPMQLTLRTCAQILLLDAAASVISLFISPQLARLLFSFFAVQLEAPGLPYTAVGIPRMVLSWSYGIGIGFVVAVVGAFLTIRTVSRISPVEALRQAASTPKTVSLPKRVLALAALAGSIAVVTCGMFITKHVDIEQIQQLSFSTLSPLFYCCVLAAVLFVAAICFAGPAVLAGTVRTWTAVLPFHSPSWRIACGQAVSRARRSTSTVIPLVAGMILVMSYTGLTQIFRATLVMMPRNLAAEWEVPGFVRILALLGPALLLVLTGVLAGYLISTHGRGLDLALLSVAGAEPRQLSMIAAFDGLITAVTAAVLAFIASMLVTSIFAVGMYKAFGLVGFAVPWKQWLFILIVLLPVSTGISWLTVRRSLQESPAAYIARYSDE